MKSNLYKFFLELLKNDVDRKISKDWNAACMYRHLIQLMGEEEFNILFTNYADQYPDNFDEFYFNLHKSFRQIDVYDFQGADCIGRRRIQSNREYYEEIAKKRDGNIEGAYILFPIGGHLDMLFWNLIHIKTELWDYVLKKAYDYYHNTSEIN